ncbi:MAG TPA: flagellar export protein FliJ [Holophaga sp.]|nr:flagellar export protein FliJ [Holophaga sp.]
MAARFRFRLEALLRVRRSLEEEAKRSVARAVAARDEAQVRVGELRQTQRQAIESRRSGPGQVLDLERLKAVERWLLVLERRILEAVEAVKQAEARVREARAALVKAHQDHLIIQRLKERRQEQHALEVLREETKEMDEIAVLRHHFARVKASNQ